MYQMQKANNTERKLDQEREAAEGNHSDESKYYYDDATGYEIYREEEDEEDHSPEAGETDT